VLPQDVGATTGSRGDNMFVIFARLFMVVVIIIVVIIAVIGATSPHNTT
jgi:hypothetical protein